MTEPDFKHEYLFVLGNGASIASADPRLNDFFQCTPTIGNFIYLMKKILDVHNFFELSDLMEENHLELLRNEFISEAIAISERKGKDDVVKLLASLEHDKANVGKEMAGMDQNWSNDPKLLKKYTCEVRPIIEDIRTLNHAIYHMVAACYKNPKEEYFETLWQIVEQNKALVISLNWDINFETVIYEKNPTISIAHYYGECLFNLLPPDQKNEPYNPIVEILKPHGSLNWLIPTAIQATYGNPNTNSGQMQPGSHLRVVDNLPENFNSEYKCFLIPPVPDKAAVNEYSGLFWKIKEAIKNDIFARIKEYAITTRTLVIIGYSFPPEDEHIKNLFAINRFENVLVFDTNEEVFQRIKGYFPKAKPEFKKGGFAEIMDWPDVGEGFKPSRSE